MINVFGMALCYHHGKICSRLPSLYRSIVSALLLFVSCGAKSVATATIYDETWEHHAAAFTALDVQATCADYANTSHIIVVDQASSQRNDYHGEEGCVVMFTTLFERLRGADGSLTSDFAWADDSAPIVDDNVVFISWNSSAPSYIYEWATDTFVMDAQGLITHHHIFANGRAVTTAEKHAPARKNTGPLDLPAQGWSTWNTFRCQIDEELIQTSILALSDSGSLRAAGYDWILIDDCWTACDELLTDGTCARPAPRDARGRIVVDRTKFPRGFKPLTALAHSLGLKIGIYTSVSAVTCAGFEGSLHNEEIDAQAFVEWGFDLVKHDTCQADYSVHDGSLQNATRRMRDALFAEGRGETVYYLDSGNPTSPQRLYNPHQHHVTDAEALAKLAVRPEELAWVWSRQLDAEDGGAELNRGPHMLKIWFDRDARAGERARCLLVRFHQTEFWLGGSAAEKRPQCRESAAEGVIWVNCPIRLIDLSSRILAVHFTSLGQRRIALSREPRAPPSLPQDTWASVLTNAHAQAPTAPYHRANHFIFADMLTLGMGGQSEAEYRTQFFLWAVLGSPLILGNDIREMDAFTTELVTSVEVLAVNQDPDCVQGSLLRALGSTEIWGRPLADGSFAVVALNKGEGDTNATVWFDGDWHGHQDLFPASFASARVRDLHQRKDLGVFEHRFDVHLAPHDATIVRVEPADA